MQLPPMAVLLEENAPYVNNYLDKLSETCIRVLFRGKKVDWRLPKPYIWRYTDTDTWHIGGEWSPD